MNAELTPGSIKKFCRTSWRFQTTFVTPLNDLDGFVSTILADESMAGGAVTIDKIVFETKI